MHGKFLEQYNAKGREKAEGYDKSHFEGMSDEEKESAFDLLEKEVLAPGVAQWMYYLNARKAIAVISDIVENGFKEPQFEKAQLLGFLYDVTGVEQYFEDVLDLYDELDEKGRKKLLWLVRNSRASDLRKKEFYTNTVFSEVGSEPLTTASDFYLVSIGAKRSSEKERKQFYSDREQLVESDLNTRGPLMRHFEKKYDENV